MLRVTTCPDCTSYYSYFPSVSKKYERSGYNGKQVYRKDTDLPTDEQEAYRERLQDCEKKFKESRALVVSMQESKTECKPVTPTPAPAPIISLASSSNNSIPEDRLVAMRSQIDRAATMMGMGTATINRFATSPVLSPATGLSPLQMRQALMMQRQRAAMFGPGLPFTSLTSSLHHPATTSAFVGSADKLLVDLYQRRQQLLMARMAPDPTAAMSTEVASSTGASLGEKRGMGEIGLQVDEQARKRARAA